MGKLWVLALCVCALSGCTSVKHGYAHVSARSSGAVWHQPNAAPNRIELYPSYSEYSDWEEARARRERRRWEAEESYRRWFKSLTEEERERVRQRERELDALLQSLAVRTS